MCFLKGDFFIIKGIPYILAVQRRQKGLKLLKLNVIHIFSLDRW